MEEGCLSIVSSYKAMIEVNSPQGLIVSYSLLLFEAPDIVKTCNI